MSEKKVINFQKKNQFRYRVGKALFENKFAILAAIFIVLFLAQIPKFADQDNLILGRSPAFWGIPMALLAIWIISWLKGVGWSDIGLTRPEKWSEIMRTALITLLVVQVVGILQIYLTPTSPDLSSYEEGLTFPVLLRWILISWTTAGIGEEIIWRGFLIKQIARLFGEQKSSSWLIGLVLSSIGFGLAHFHQGPGGMVGIGVVGLVYGAAYFYSGRNLWVPIIAHGLTGSTRFILLYLSQNL